jgi:hypothetical protein
VIVGCARASTAQRNLDHRIDALPSAGVDRAGRFADLVGVPRSTVYGYLHRATAGTPA